MKRKIFLFLSLCALFSGAAYAQDDGVSIPFNGMVTDMQGNPLKGVRVHVYDRKVYTTSDKKGRFGLTNVKENDTLHLKYNKVYYDIPVEGRKSIRIRIADEVQADEDQDLISIGMMYVKKREFLSPYSGISGEMLRRTGRTHINDALIGLVPGLTMMNGKLLIRGISSLNLSNEPLYVVDEVVVPTLEYVSVYDVDKVVVHKDGSMYGSRGANGVIVVTTKR